MYVNSKPTPSGASPDGFGKFRPVTDLPNAEREKIHQQLYARPELLSEGMIAVRLRRESDERVKKLKAKLHAAVGGDRVNRAVEMLEQLIDHDDALAAREADRVKFVEAQKAVRK